MLVCRILHGKFECLPTKLYKNRRKRTFCEKRAVGCENIYLIEKINGKRKRAEANKKNEPKIPLHADQNSAIILSEI